MTRLPGLVLLHGAGDDGTCWGPFVRSLGLPDLQVVTPDAPAHGGRRAGPGETIAWADLLAAAVAATEAHVQATGGPVVVGGHSMGASTALGVAATRPDLALALFLEDPPFSGHMADDAPEPGVKPVDLIRLHDWFAGMQSATLDHVIATARFEHPHWDPDEYEPWARSKQAVDVEAFARPVATVGPGWATLARRVTCPTVVVAGDPHFGAVVSLSAGNDLARLPGWTIHRLPVSHDVRRDAPGETQRILRDLILSIAA